MKEIKEKQEKKKTGLLMGKLHDDMIFLDKGGFLKYLFNTQNVPLKDWLGVCVLCDNVYMNQIIVKNKNIDNININNGMGSIF